MPLFRGRSGARDATSRPLECVASFRLQDNKKQSNWPNMGSIRVADAEKTQDSYAKCLLCFGMLRGGGRNVEGWGESEC